MITLCCEVGGCMLFFITDWAAVFGTAFVTFNLIRNYGSQQSTVNIEELFRMLLDYQFKLDDVIADLKNNLSWQ